MIGIFCSWKRDEVMLNIETKQSNISIELKRKIEMIFKFNNLKCEFINGNIINIKRTNIAYVEPHKVVIDTETFSLFNDCNLIYIETLDNKIPISELDKYLKLK